MISLKSFYFPFEFPLKAMPSWAPLVERWPQLDAASVGLAQAYTHFREELGRAPAWILLASPQASNDTDGLFVASGAASPSKFVHTLPNIRSAALLKLMEWSGPLLCLQKDPETLKSALIEGAGLLQSGAGPVWIAHLEKNKGWAASFFVLSAADEGNLRLQKTATTGFSTSSDKDLLDWLSKNEETSVFSLAEGWEIVKSASS